jgi:hypothetical protein
MANHNPFIIHVKKNLLSNIHIVFIHSLHLSGVTTGFRPYRVLYKQRSAFSQVISTYSLIHAAKDFIIFLNK